MKIESNDWLLVERDFDRPSYFRSGLVDRQSLKTPRESLIADACSNSEQNSVPSCTGPINSNLKVERPAQTGNADGAEITAKSAHSKGAKIRGQLLTTY
jgi:hypothetical protein